MSAVERVQLGHLAGHGVESQAVPVKHSMQFGAGGDHRGAQGADRALLLEQRGGEQAPPFPGRPYPCADLSCECAGADHPLCSFCG